MMRACAGFRYAAALLLAGVMLAAGGSPAAAAEYAVIVNAANPDAGKGEALGTPAQPLARPADSPAQKAFVAKVLGMDQATLDQHWLRLKQTKGETPPREVGSALILTRLVSKYEGAFSVVSAEEAAALPEGVAVLFRFTD